MVAWSPEEPDLELEQPKAPPSPDVSLVSEAPQGGLRYPFDDLPGFGASREVAPGVRWLRMPLGGSLAAINVWAIEDGDGWAIVDTGLGTTETIELWRSAIAAELKRPVTRVFVTHMHPDHIGSAGWLTRTYDCELWISRLEFLMCRSLAADTGRPAPDAALRFYREAGWDEDVLGLYRARFGGFGRMLHALPDSFRRLEDGQIVRIGAHDWRVVVGSGHSPEHACLYCEALGLMISGDQVLPKISSNVSVFPTEPFADPLTDWLTSLARIRGQVPDDVLVLPAHNAPFFGLHARIGELIDHHEEALTQLRAMLATPRRAIDVFPALFKRTINREVVGMATGESLAHLNCLLARGQATSSTDTAGVRWYQAA
jgi:glyoxylase-like metal-dependent hydrolase (beta-lactamase superfamily II)